MSKTINGVIRLSNRGMSIYIFGDGDIGAYKYHTKNGKTYIGTPNVP